MGLTPPLQLPYYARFVFKSTSRRLYELTHAIIQGLTIYKALKQSKAQIGEWIAISGAGGGLGHLGVQYAAAMGLRVLAIGELARSNHL